MIECTKQVNQRRLGWISTQVLVLFAFLMTLPFAGQSVALTAHSDAAMATVTAPQEHLNLQTFANSQAFADTKSHDHHKMSRSSEGPVARSSKLCVSMGHVAHKTHICCFDGAITDRTVMRRDLRAIEKLIFVSSSKAAFGPAVEPKQHVLAIEFQNGQSATPQLVGLIGAGAQFVRTQRLLT